MSRKFLDTESPGWVTDGIISEAQRQQLLARYPPEAQALGLLPVLGSVLVGLSGLSVVAANWPALPAVLRVALLLGSLLGAYGAGAYFLRRGNPDLGHGLIGLGLILFGVSIILTSQLFQLVGYDVSGLLPGGGRRGPELRVRLAAAGAAHGADWGGRANLLRAVVGQL